MTPQILTAAKCDSTTHYMGCKCHEDIRNFQIDALRAENERFRTSNEHQFATFHEDLAETLGVLPGGSVIEAVEALRAENEKINREYIKALNYGVDITKEREEVLELYGRFAETFGDLSNCYDTDDVTRVIRRAFDELKEENSNLKAVADAAIVTVKQYWKFDKSMKSEIVSLESATRRAGRWEG